jgi:hypothetical protein
MSQHSKMVVGVVLSTLVVLDAFITFKKTNTPNQPESLTKRTHGRNGNRCTRSLNSDARRATPPQNESHRRTDTPNPSTEQSNIPRKDNNNYPSPPNAKPTPPPTSGTGHESVPNHMPVAPQTPDHYFNLGLSKTATSAEIKKAYHKLALLFHPDKLTSSEKDDGTKFRMVRGTE